MVVFLSPSDQVLPETTIRRLPSTSFSNQYSLVTLSFDTLRLALSKASSDQATKQILTMATVQIGR